MRLWFDLVRISRAFAVLWIVACVASLAGSPAAHAQTFREFITPDRPVVDGRGVDVALGEVNATVDPVTVGDLASSASWAGVTNFNKFYAYIGASTTDRYVFLHGKSLKFKLVGGVYVAANGDGSTLVKSTSGVETWTYTSAEGAVYYFVRRVPVFQPDWATIRAHLSTVLQPDGRKLTYNYKDEFGAQICGHQCYTPTKIRVQSITSSDGLMLKAEYASTAYGVDFNRVTKIQAINLSQDYCDRDADSCTALTQTWPSQTFAQSTSGGTTTHTITDQDSTTTSVEIASQGVTEIVRPTDSSGNLEATYGGSGRVDQVVADGATYTYNYSTSGSVQTTTVTGPGSATETYVVDTTISRPTSITNAAGQTTSFQYDASARKTRETYPDGNYIQWTYDSRGNVTEERQVAKSGSGLADIVATASFDTTCSNTKTCNKPNYVIDARGKRTDFTYDATHGGVTRVQLPAPNGNSPRPEINYGYTQFTGEIRNSAGVLVSTGDPQYKVTQITTCATAATCAGTANETKVTIAYNTPNLLPTSVTTAAGDGSLTSTVTYAYNLLGDISAIDGPLAGSDDTTYYLYGPTKRLKGIIGPDPDGTGPRLRQAIRHSFVGFKPTYKTEVGTVTGVSLTALNAITPIQTIDYTYDLQGNKTKEVMSGTAGAVGVTQFSYDAKNRLVCTAVRMNPSTWGSLPAACTTATAGSFGPDRISRNTYDAAGRITKVETAVGTAAASDEVRVAYTNNGPVSYVIDAENNRTTYIYDGHDRLSQTRYPVTTKGADASNSSDYEQLTYDAAGNVTGRQLRDGTTIGYSYDDLGRLVTKDLPGTEPDVTYAYDLMGRATGVTQSSHSVDLAHNALGQVTSQTGPLGTIGYTYDAAGRRLSMSYPGGSLTINYEYDVAGNVLVIRENGATSGIGVLATYDYDNVGRRANVTFGNGGVQSFAYDAASQLATLSNKPVAGSTLRDLTQTFTYNPSSQIAGVTRSNDTYAWQSHYNVDRAYGANGLNQITSAGSATITYDARGNLSSDGSNSYSYTAENMLKASSNGATLAYDPLGRLFETARSSVAARFMYDGIDLIAEYDGSNVLKHRYVHGPGIDNPIVWYKGSTPSDLSKRFFMMADERGSIVSSSNVTQTDAITSSYDEYGIPDADNPGYRFGYIGQVWLPEVGMWHYKARTYSPTLGRFMQTDPIGYEDGMNWYNYVKADPMNWKDSSGLTAEEGLGWCEIYGSFLISCLAPPDDSDVLVVARRIRVSFDPSGSQLFVPLHLLPVNARVVLKNRRQCPSGGVLLLMPDGYDIAFPTDPDDRSIWLTPAGLPPPFRMATSQEHSNLIRIMLPGRNARNPQGYFVVYNSAGQPISPSTGRTVPKSQWHIPLSHLGVERNGRPIC